MSTVIITFGLIIHFTFFKMNKQLWSTSYLFFMAGTCGESFFLLLLLSSSSLSHECFIY